MQIYTYVIYLQNGNPEELNLGVGRESELEHGSLPLLPLGNLRGRGHRHHTQLRQQHGLAVLLGARAYGTESAGGNDEFGSLRLARGLGLAGVVLARCRGRVLSHATLEAREALELELGLGLGLRVLRVRNRVMATLRNSADVTTIL